MKNFGKLITLGAMILALVSCGKDNKSGSDPAAAVTTTEAPSIGNASAINYTSYEDIKKAYSEKALNIGTTNDMVVYHIGPGYGGEDFNNLNIDFEYEIDFGVCFQFLWYSSGDCGTERNGGNNQVDQYADIISRGKYKVVKSSNKDEVNYEVAVEASQNGFEFNGGTFNRNNDVFRAMLNLDNKSVKTVVIKPAEVILTDGSSITADYVEYFYSDGRVEGFVLSNELPLISNPIARTEEHDLVGALSFSGTKTIQRITVNIHEVRNEPFSGVYTYVPREVGSRSITF